MDTSHAYNGAMHNTTEYSPYMNIDVQAPPDDFGSSEGLCGNWNGDNSDDFIGGDGIQYQSSSVANFSKSWMFVSFLFMLFFCGNQERAVTRFTFFSHILL